jgi:hypothetical protein
MMAHGRSTRAHNTCNYNGWNQAVNEPVGTHFSHAPGHDLICSQYQAGYWNGAYTWSFAQGVKEGLSASHHRIMTWLHGRYLVVIDTLYRVPGQIPELPGTAPSVESNWQFASGPVVAEDDRAYTTGQTENLLLLFADKPSGAHVTIHEGEENPPRGWLSYPGRGFRPAPQVCVCADHATGHWSDFVTVLVPFHGQEPPRVQATITRPDPNLVTRLHLQWENGGSDEWLWTYRVICPLGTYGQTDGSLAYFRRDEAGNLLSGAAFKATYCDAFGEAATRHEDWLIRGETI